MFLLGKNQGGIEKYNGKSKNNLEAYKPLINNLANHLSIPPSFPQFLYPFLP